MKGPHGLNDIWFTDLEVHGTLTAHSYWLQNKEGLVYTEIEIVEAMSPEDMCATARCLHVEGDDATLEAAKQWLLDIANARYG